MHRFLLIGLFLLALGIVAFQSLPVKRFVAYQLGISGDSCCIGVNEILSANGNFEEGANVAVFNNKEIDYPETSLAYATLPPNLDPNSRVLGTTTTAGEEKWIEVSLAQQMLRAWEGNKIVMEFAISSGRWFPTPTGTFDIWYKTRSQTMKGGSKELGTYYNLPNVPFNMFFKGGIAVHGAYWHNNFGHPMSHGCVNTPVDQAAKLFAWTGPVVPEGKNYVKATPENPGTKVFVH